MHVSMAICGWNISEIILTILQDVNNWIIAGIQRCHPPKSWFSSQSLLSHVIHKQTTLQPVSKSRLFQQVTNICKRSVQILFNASNQRKHLPLCPSCSWFRHISNVSHYPLKLARIQIFILLFRATWEVLLQSVLVVHDCSPSSSISASAEAAFSCAGSPGKTCATVWMSSSICSSDNRSSLSSTIWRETGF